MKTMIKLLLIGLFAGLGYLHYVYIGCASGTCPISSNPYVSTGYGALLGAFVGFAIFPAIRKKTSKE